MRDGEARVVARKSEGNSEVRLFCLRGSTTSSPKPARFQPWAAAAIFAIALGCGVSLSHPAMSQPAITDGAFSSPNYVGTSPGWEYLNGEYGGWNFVSGATGDVGVPDAIGNAGISSNINIWFAGTPPVGDQAAFFQNGGEISQTINAIAPGQDYQISLYAAARPYGFEYSDPFSVSVDGTPVLYADPAQTGFVEYTSQTFYSGANSVSLSIAGQFAECVPDNMSCDEDTAINDVVITPVSPTSGGTASSAQVEVDEPSSVAVLSGALVMLMVAGGLGRRKLVS